MSQPTHTSLDAPYRAKTAGPPAGPPPAPDASASGVILVIGRGNWQQGKGNAVPLDRPKWMATVAIDGRLIYGVAPGMPFAAGEDVVLPGENAWGEYLYLDLATLGYADGKLHSLYTGLYAASYWPGGWGDNVQQPPGWEWGHFAADDDDPAAFVQSFQIAAPAPSPIPQIDVAALRQHQIDEIIPLFQQWKRNGHTLENVRDLRYPRAYELLVEGLGRPTFAQLYASL